MFLNRKIITAFDTNMLGYPIGPEKDAYFVLTTFQYNVETLEVETKHELIKNLTSEEKIPGKVYPEDKKFKVILFKGTYKECEQYFIDNVLNTQREWIRDEKLNYIYPEQ